MKKEIKNCTNLKHWTCCLKDEIPQSMTLSSPWKFKIKRNRSTGDTIKFQARFYSDSMSKEIRANYH